MNDFTRCFQIGLAQGAFGGMLGFNSWNFNFGCCSNPFAFGTPTPMFFTPSFNFFNTYQYSNPMVNVPFMGLSPMPKMDYSWDNSSIWSNNRGKYTKNRILFRQNAAFFYMVLEVGLEPTKPEGERFTVSCHCH